MKHLVQDKQTDKPSVMGNEANQQIYSKEGGIPAARDNDQPDGS